MFEAKIIYDLKFHGKLRKKEPNKVICVWFINRKPDSDTMIPVYGINTVYNPIKKITMTSHGE